MTSRYKYLKDIEHMNYELKDVIVNKIRCKAFIICERGAIQENNKICYQYLDSNQCNVWVEDVQETLFNLIGNIQFDTNGNMINPYLK